MVEVGWSESKVFNIPTWILKLQFGYLINHLKEITGNYPGNVSLMKSRRTMIVQSMWMRSSTHGNTTVADLLFCNISVSRHG